MLTSTIDQGLELGTLVLGAGPAGLAAGWALEGLGRDYRILEKSTVHGGNARTVRFGEFRYDTGPHRFHARDPLATRRVMEICADDLLEVKAPSRIYWDGRYVDFPLRPVQILKSGGLAYALRAGFDFLTSRLRYGDRDSAEDFASFASACFGKTIADTFLIPFSEKLWGLPASCLSPHIAGRRLPGFSITAMAKDLMAVSRNVEHLEGRFLYPRMGYGQIADRMAERLAPQKLLYQNQVVRIDNRGDAITGVAVKMGDGVRQFSPGSVINTLPITALVGMMNPPPPKEVLDAAAQLRFRDLVLVALFLDQESVSDAAVTYFPVENCKFTRAHEPRNRSRSMSPVGQTSLVVEFPCFVGDGLWSKTEEQLVRELVRYLEKIGLIDAGKLIGSDVHRLTNAYPIYARGYQQTSEVILSYLGQFSNLWSLGRGGGFFYGHVHDFITDGFLAAEAANHYLLARSPARR